MDKEHKLKKGIIEKKEIKKLIKLNELLEKNKLYQLTCHQKNCYQVQSIVFRQLPQKYQKKIEIIRRGCEEDYPRKARIILNNFI